MPRIAIINIETGKVVNIGESDGAPEIREIPPMPEGDDVTESDLEVWNAEKDGIEAHNAFVNAHEFVESETANIGDDYDGTDIAPPVAEETAETKAAILAAHRYEKEVGGLDYNGVRVSTAREERANYIAVNINARRDPQYEVEYKTPAGFISLGSEGIIGMTDAVAEHVQKCFRAEKAVLDDIDNYETADDIRAAFETSYKGA